MALASGQKLGPYDILTPLGAGGMGEVYRARDTRLDREVAIKVLPESTTRDADRIARFDREAKSVAALNHPNIVTIHGTHDEAGHRFIVMELVEGEALDRMIAPGGMPLARIFDVAIPLADALAAAHDKGIVHRDLKPGNVMITRDGRVKVLDFGLAKLTTEETGGSSPRDDTVSAPLTGHGAILGTVPYMSPEQLRGEAVDHRTDLFSLGVILYEMAAGQRPFKGTRSADMISSILRDTPRPLHEWNSSLPRPLEKVVALCLEKDPENRLQSAKDVRNELRLLRKEVDSDTPESVPLMIVTGSPAAPATVPQGSATTLGSAMSAPTRRGEFWIGIAALIAAVVVVGWWLGRGVTAPVKHAATVDSGVTIPKLSPAETSVIFAPPTEVNSLAVLPFTNLTSDKEQEYFSDGLTEELLNALVKIPDLKVAGRTSSFSFKGKNEDLRTIGEKLGVANILEGSVRKSGDRVRITAQLVKAAEGFHLWSEVYDRTLNDIFAVQDDIAKSVAEALKVTLLGKSAEPTTPNAEAYDLVLQARYIMRSGTEDSIRRARTVLERALALAPEYAAVWAEMGLLHRKTYERTLTVEAAQEALRQVRHALTRALELDPELALAHSRMASAQLALWDFAGRRAFHGPGAGGGPEEPAGAR